MRRADRLFRVIQILRRSRRPVTAESVAAELSISVRSVYRDMADLTSQGVPIRGEAGVGYTLDRRYDMPPLMLTPEELEAAVLGAQWVAERGDAALANAARDLLSKITAAIPPSLRTFITEPTSAHRRTISLLGTGSTLRRPAPGFVPDGSCAFNTETKPGRRPNGLCGRSSSAMQTPYDSLLPGVSCAMVSGISEQIESFGPTSSMRRMAPPCQT